MSDRMNKMTETARALLTRKRMAALGGSVAFVLLLAFGPWGGLKDSDGDRLTYTVTRGNLVVEVLESGSVEASESEIIKSKVEGTTTIISIAPEGTILTEKDVEDKKVIVELDSSDLREKEVQQLITVQGAEAQYTEAKESYEIQVNQNESNLNAGELKVKFARVDLDKYLGETVAKLFIEEKVELSDLIASEKLGGEALQKKRELENKIDLAKEETVRAAVKLDWTKKLFEKGYVTRDDLQADELGLKRKEVETEQAETALELFERYEFRKQAEKLRSDYKEAVKELERIKAKNLAELSKAEAKLKSSEATYKNQLDQLKKIQEQIENCIITAPKPGLLVYAKSDRPWQNDQIGEGKAVRERQEIITIPSSSAMAVKTKVHESVITRIKEGQKASITIDSLPENKYEGTVKKVAILPDAQDFWLNSNLKVYETEIAILGDNPELKPGMSAQVRIIVSELEDVLMIPLQAVSTQGEEKICFVKTAFGAKKRVIETGDYNDKFIEVSKGLNEGDTVILNAWDLANEEAAELQSS